MNNLVGDGLAECAICKAPITKYRTLGVKITSNVPEEARTHLATLKYFLPLCEEHGKRKEVVDILLEWENDTPVEQVMA